MNSSPHLEIDFLLASQADKHVTVNDGFERLDALTQLSVLSVGSNIAPSNPNPGDRHIVGSAPLGEWSRQANYIAMWSIGGWHFFKPKPGWFAWNGVTRSKLVWDGFAWTDWVVPAGSSLQNMGPIGINAAASPRNPLTSAGSNTLLTHAGGGHMLAVNKADENSRDYIAKQLCRSRGIVFGKCQHLAAEIFT
jgi:Protein of unknown function (DUF2793)